MASVNAKAVAQEISETLGKGKKVNLGKILKKYGYSDSTSKTPKNVLDTESFKTEIDPFVKAMIEERDAVILRMKKVRGKAKYRDLTDALDKITKNIQLLNGGKTANEVIQISWES